MAFCAPSMREPREGENYAEKGAMIGWHRTVHITVQFIAAVPVNDGVSCVEQAEASAGRRLRNGVTSSGCHRPEPSESRPSGTVTRKCVSQISTTSPQVDP